MADTDDTPDPAVLRDSARGTPIGPPPDTSVGPYTPDPEPVVVATGTRHDGTRLEDDAEHVSRVRHTAAPPIDPDSETHAAASQEGGPRSAKSPHQDAQQALDTASAWEASPPPDPDDQVGED